MVQNYLKESCQDATCKDKPVNHQFPPGTSQIENMTEPRQAAVNLLREKPPPLAPQLPLSPIALMRGNPLANIKWREKHLHFY